MTDRFHAEISPQFLVLFPLLKDLDCVGLCNSNLLTEDGVFLSVEITLNQTVLITKCVSGGKFEAILSFPQHLSALLVILLHSLHSSHCQVCVKWSNI